MIRPQLPPRPMCFPRGLFSGTELRSRRSGSLGSGPVAGASPMPGGGAVRRAPDGGDLSARHYCRIELPAGPQPCKCW